MSEKDRKKLERSLTPGGVIEYKCSDTGKWFKCRVVFKGLGYISVEYGPGQETELEVNWVLDSGLFRPIPSDRVILIDKGDHFATKPVTTS